MDEHSLLKFCCGELGVRMWSGRTASLVLFPDVTQSSGAGGKVLSDKVTGEGGACRAAGQLSAALQTQILSENSDMAPCYLCSIIL